MRISIVGSSGSGKSSLAAAVHDRTGTPVIELDAINHQPGWTELHPEEFRSRVDAALATEAWVCDGNYQGRLGGAVQAAADTVVWFDLPRARVMRQLVRRTLTRMVRREELWNGNRERPHTLRHWDPEKNLLRWAWVNHERYRAAYEACAEGDAWAHAAVVRVTSHADATAWLRTLPSV